MAVLVGGQVVILVVIEAVLQFGPIAVGVIQVAFQVGQVVFGRLVEIEIVFVIFGRPGNWRTALSLGPAGRWLGSSGASAATSPAAAAPFIAAGTGRVGRFGGRVALFRAFFRLGRGHWPGRIVCQSIICRSIVARLIRSGAASAPAPSTALAARFLFFGGALRVRAVARFAFGERAVGKAALRILKIAGLAACRSIMAGGKFTVCRDLTACRLVARG